VRARCQSPPDWRIVSSVRQGATQQDGESDAWSARSSGARQLARDHVWRNVRLLLETFGVTASMFVAAWWAVLNDLPVVAWLLAVPRGLWIQRHYCVGHEAAHGKLFPGRPLVNDLFGQLALFVLLTPLPVFRKIHRFHHGHNRRDLETSALDVIWIRKDTALRRASARARWFVAVFGCGWFWHGLVSVVLFLGLPLRVAERISPAFRGWTLRERLLSTAAFGVALMFHATCVVLVGVELGVPLVLPPLVAFSWIYSAQLYIYHYDTNIGPNVTQHARSLGGSLVGWWLLNLNEHATHHQSPAVVWYALRDLARRENAEKPGEHRRSFAWGIVNQLRGPRIVVRSEQP
jgi:fatty acid desaturase